MADFDDAFEESSPPVKHSTGTLKGPVLITTMHSAAIKPKPNQPTMTAQLDDDDLADLDDLDENHDPSSVSKSRLEPQLTNELGNLTIRNQGAGPSPRAHSPTSFNAQSISINSNPASTSSFPPHTSESSKSAVEAALNRFLAYCRSAKVGPPSITAASNAEALLNDLRRAVLFHGLPIEASPPATIASYSGPQSSSSQDETPESMDGGDDDALPPVPDAATLSTQSMCSLRGKVWKALMMGPLFCQRLAEGINHSNTNDNINNKTEGNETDSKTQGTKTTSSTTPPPPPSSSSLLTSSPMKTPKKASAPSSPSPSSLSPSLSAISTSSRGGNPANPATNRSGTSTSSPSTSASSITSTLLATPYVLAEEYVMLCKEKCAPKQYQLIRDDSFRTFRTRDPANKFLRAVPEQAIVRVCNAFDRKFASQGWGYQQGLNVFAGVLLYVLPELDAFNLFCILVTQFVPLYFRSNHIGAHAGCVLVDSTLAIVDPELFAHLNSCNPRIRAINSSFHAVTSLCASVPPIDEVLLLWDFLFAMGPHMAILIVVAQLVSIRSKVSQYQCLSPSYSMFVYRLLFITYHIAM